MEARNPRSMFPSGTLLDAWRCVRVPAGPPDGWAREQLAAGLVELERITRETEAAKGLLATAVVASRDARTFLASCTGMAVRDAVGVSRVAEVFVKVPAAVDALRCGAVSAGHVRALAELAAADPDEADALLETAPARTVEQLERDARAALIALDGAGTAQRQRRARSVRFRRGEHGCVHASVVLPPVEGLEFKNRLEAIADARYRAEHPDRAESTEANLVDPLEQRLADALVDLVRGTARYNTGTATAPGQADGTGTARNSDATGTAPDNSDATGTAPNAAEPTPRASGATTNPAANPTTNPRAGRPSVIITINAETLDAEAIGAGPIPLSAAVEAAARGDLYAAIRNMHGITINFGRSTRFATPLQRLALIAQHRHCQWPGCVSTRSLHAHHLTPATAGGPTDLQNLVLLCGRHHRHLHLTRSEIRRCPDGTITAHPPPDLADTG